MGKKTTNTKTAAPVRRSAKTKPVAGKAVAVKPGATQSKALAPTPKTAVGKKTKRPFSQDEVALRAYFLAERRQAAGLPGDAHQDWIQAERQLAFESKKALAAKAGKKR